MPINIHGGGARTNQNGLKFEQETSLEHALINAGYTITSRNTIIDEHNNCLGIIAPKHSFYKRILWHYYTSNYNWPC